MWVPFTRTDGPAWTPEEVAAIVGTVRTIQNVPDLAGSTGTVNWRVLDARTTDDPFRLELFVEPA
jgi:hypothetical protein